MKRHSEEYYSELSSCLMEVECSLRNLQLWSSTPPSQEAFESTAPFSVDTMDFNEWLQFVFIPKLKAIVEGRNELPHVSGIAPMAEEFFRVKGIAVDAKSPVRRAGVYSSYTLIVELKKMDELLSL